MGLFDNKQKQFDDIYTRTMNTINTDGISSSADRNRLEKAVEYYANAFESKYADERTFYLSAAAVEQNFIMISMLSEILGKLKDQ